MKLSLIQLIVIVVSTTAYSINPMREYKMSPETFAINHEEHRLITRDYYELNLWLMKSNKETKKDITIAIVGSDSGNMGFSLPYAFQLLNLGYQVITFDYRGFGSSCDFNYNPNNVYHSEYIIDFNTVIKWCKEELDYTKLGTLSFSMGTLISSVGYSSNNYDFYIGEGFIASPQYNKLRVETLKRKKMFLPDTASNDAISIEKLNITILLFASTNDKITTAKDCHDFCNRHKLAQTIEYDGEHLRGAPSLGIQDYMTAIDVFVKSIDDNSR